MKYIILLSVFFIVSCDVKTKSYTEDKEYSPEIEREAKRRTDSMMKEIQRNALLDTVGISSAPVKVTKARLSERDYSNYKDMVLTFKNVSGKKISAIRFGWYGEDAFGDPADMGSYVLDGYGGGYDDDPLGIGKSRTSTWSMVTKRCKKIIAAWPTEVMFEDGTKWEK